MNTSIDTVRLQAALQELSESPGTILVKARERKNIPREKICSDLGITATMLRALESDQLDKLPPPVYVKGYARRYCDILGIRPTPLLATLEDLYRTASEKHTGETASVGSRREGRLIWPRGLAISLLALTAVSWALYPEENEGVAEAYQAETGTSEALQPFQEALTLSIVEDSWVEVVDARDHILAVNLYRAGSHVALEGKPPFQVSLGSPSGVEVYFRGEPVEFKQDVQGSSIKLIVGQ